ncbi:MAG TPA: APC family permease [Polyangia bacterium]|jgi:amino acid transporter|nr:APC family permease [Polyangia bacterium]
MSTQSSEARAPKDDDASPFPETPNRPLPAAPSLPQKIRRALVGRPKDLRDSQLFHSISLIPFLAWVGLGADGLSSSAYGPEEAFKTLGQHTYLAVALALMAGLTVFIISAGYRGIIEAFPHGGGGYVVASKLLGRSAGVISGSALLVDYVLTITVSIAAAGDVIFSFLPIGLAGLKMPLEIFFIVGLTTLNIRGVRESAIALAPIFMVFVVSHVIVIVAGILGHASALPATTHAVTTGFSSGAKTLGMGGMLLLFIHAYSLGGGTYTGIEAVSNGLPIMREPRVQTAKRTMLYMAVSLAFTASGLLICYLLWDVSPMPGKTLNAVLVEKMTANIPGGTVMSIVTLFSEGILLVVAAQAGFLDGPRVLANMAVDHWVPRRFAALSDRLTTHNGIVLMGAASLGALVYTGGDVGKLVVMYSINVFLTFSLSLFGMARKTWSERKTQRLAAFARSFSTFLVGFCLCAVILVITVAEKFTEGGWLTLVVTAVVVGLCFLIRRHYRHVRRRLLALYHDVRTIDDGTHAPLPVLRPELPTACILVSSYDGVGVHTVLNVFRSFPNHFKNLVFVSVGVIDSGGFKGGDSVEALEAQTVSTLKRYCSLATTLEMPSTYKLGLGTDAVAEAESVCRRVMAEFPVVTFIGGKVIFAREKWFQRFLHNETALAIQKRLYWMGATMVVLPAKVT